MLEFLFWFGSYLVMVFVALVCTYKMYEAKKITPRDYWDEWPHPLLIAFGGPISLIIFLIVAFFKWFNKTAKKLADSFKIEVKK